MSYTAVTRVYSQPLYSLEFRISKFPDQTFKVSGSPELLEYIEEQFIRLAELEAIHRSAPKFPIDPSHG